MGRPGKLKSGSKTKIKKWQKGSSCASNPDTQKHRAKAKSKFLHMQPATKSTKGLTLEKLQIHDELQGFSSSRQIPMDAASSDGAPTFGSFLSGLSDCTNVTFGKIQRFWLNNSAKHKEVCAVLAAITEVIRGQGAAESNTAYFAALVTALQSVEQVESATAVAYLLAMTCKQVPVPVLRAKFGEVSKLLCDILNQNMGSIESSPPTALIRSVLSCLGTLLRQQGLHVWDDRSTFNIYHTILNFTVHNKPKIRKAAQNAVCSILFASSFIIEEESKVKNHPAASTTAKFCVDHLEKFGGMSSSPSVCHVMTLLGRILHSFPPQLLKQSCETILRLMTLSEPIVKSVCLQALYKMFLNQPSSSNLSAALTAQIMSALYEYYPNSSDAQMCPAWLTVMEKSLLHLTTQFSDSDNVSNANKLSIVHIPKLLLTCFKMMLSTNRTVCEAAGSTVKVIISECTPPVLTNADAADDMKLMKAIVNLLEDGLKYKYHALWDMVFGICQIAFKTIVKAKHFSIVKTLLTNIADLRSTPQFLYRSEVDNATGSAIETLGPKLFLQAVPLNISGTEKDYDFPRSWILPLLTKHIKITELAFFTEYFLPLAAKVRARAAELKSHELAIQASTYETIQQQCWTLLPVFCKGATDIKKAFPNLARILGKALTERDDLKLLVMQALRNLLISCKSLPEDQAVVARFAKNYIPILFNIYTSPNAMPGIENDDEKQSIIDANKRKSPERLSALETIKLYLEICDQGLIQSYFVKAQGRVFDGESENDATRLALLDLLINMVVYVSIEDMNNIYQAMIPMLNSPNHSMQKKAYRLLEEICGSSNETCHQFVSCHLQELKSRLLDGLSASAPASKGPRINCMEQIVQQLATNAETHEDCIEFVQAILPEVILCTKEAKRSRLAAFNLLASAAKVFVSIYETKNQEEAGNGLVAYFDIVFNGLAGSPLMIKSSILALCRLVYEFKNEMPPALLDQTISNICLLLGCNTREVCKAALSFIMVLFSVLERATLAQYTKGILDSLLNWKPETRRHFRFRVKTILQRLVQKFGFDTINSMTPAEHKKQLQNIRKVTERTKRLQAERKLATKNETSSLQQTVIKSQKKETIDELLADSSDSEDEEPKPKSKKQDFTQRKAWLQDAQTEPMDLLDPATSQKVLATDPTQTGGKKRQSDDFKLSSDGRLIIDTGGDESEDDQETNKLLAGIGVKSKVTVKSNSKNKLDADDDSDDSEKGYRPGGKGIHRQMGAEAPGSMFKSKKSHGDVKRKNQHDPYAYIPLDSKVLNKRKRKKLSGQYDGFIKAAKKGAADGAKLKAKRKRK
uniref:RRP12-like protein n=1 Tax=Phallusia mammillata TaxID=59560 RepID=A0A6F9DS16_9ASCI|nr:RRP12-like protein [Phallusia mammillata]